MNDWEDEGSEEEDFEDANGCDYEVSEFCSDPQTKDCGLCTTECATYLDSVKEKAKP